MDPIQIIGSLVAIMVVAFMASRMFPVRTMLDEGRVRRNLERYEPSARFSDILISSDGTVALAALNSPADSLGLAVQMGDRVVCRILTKADIRAFVANTGRVHVKFNDFTQPTLTLVLDTATEKKALALLGALTSQKDQQHAA